MKREQQGADSEGCAEGDGSWKNKVSYGQPMLGSRHKQLLTQRDPSKSLCAQGVSQRFSISSSMSGVGKQRALSSWLHQTLFSL